MNRWIGVSIVLCIVFGWLPAQEDEYVKAIDDWHAQRIASLTRPDGWLSLVGLQWLKPGENTFGADSTNDILFPPKAPARIGSFFLQDTVITVSINPGVTVLCEGKPVHQRRLNHDLTGKPTILTYGSLLWYIIKRGEQYGVRIKDTLAATRLHFKGIERFPVDRRWRIRARFVPFSTLKYIDIPTVLGTITKEPSPGRLEFEIEGKTWGRNLRCRTFFVRGARGLQWFYGH